MKPFFEPVEEDIFNTLLHFHPKDLVGLRSGEFTGNLLNLFLKKEKTSNLCTALKTEHIICLITNESYP